jgi:sodium-coupled neutral amino acid transporter 11
LIKLFEKVNYNKLKDKTIDDSIKTNNPDPNPGNFLTRWFGPIGKGSLRGSTLALASLTFGSGCLAFPSAIRSVGLVMGIIFFFIISILTYYSLYIMIDAGIRKKRLDYLYLVKLTMGRKMVWVSVIMNSVLRVGAIMSYQKFCYSFASDVLEAYFSIDKKSQLVQISIISICFLFIQIPLCLLKKIHYLQYASIVGSLMLIYSIIVICIQSYSNYEISIKTFKIVPIEEFSFNYVNSLAIFIFGFCSHYGIFEILLDLKRKSKVRAAKALNRSFTLYMFVYTAIAFAGYFSFLGGTKDNILTNYGENDKLMIVSKISLFVTLHCSLAINYNILRASYESMFLKAGDKNFSFSKDLIVLITTLLLCNVFVYYVKTVAVILGIVGGVACVIMCYFNPIMIYILTNEHSRYSIYNLFAYFCLIFSCIIGLLSTGYSCVDFVTSLSK